MESRRTIVLFCAAAWLVGSFLLSAAHGQSLHERVDELIEARAGGALAPQADDAEFLRRVHLDLTGRIPSADEVRAFLASTDSMKRPLVVDKLLASPEHVSRMQQWLHVMLIERMGEHEEWTRYLRNSIEQNKPWNQFAREMLNPNSEDEATRGSAFFLSKRLENYGQNPVDVPALVRDVGRLMMGIDVQCAQCHDHLFVDDYKQEHYQGLFAFVGQVALRPGLPYPAIQEKPLTKKVDFVSVFLQEPKAIGPQLPGSSEIDVPTFAKGEEYEVSPDPKTKSPGKLKFSTLRLLSEQLPVADNQLFARNIANRLWWMMLGRGLVEPLDLHHTDNPPSHPEVLDLITRELVVHQFDMRWLIRELALTRAYLRSSRWPDAPLAVDDLRSHTYQLALEKPLLAEQLLDATLRATGADAADEKSRAEYLKKFTAAFANPPREPEVDHHPALRGALFLMNDATVLGWLEPKDGNLVDRLLKTEDSAGLADEMYLSVLSRPPSDEERAEVTGFLAAGQADRSKAISHLVWSLLASNEFCVNH